MKKRGNDHTDVKSYCFEWRTDENGRNSSGRRGKIHSNTNDLSLPLPDFNKLADGISVAEKGNIIRVLSMVSEHPWLKSERKITRQTGEVIQVNQKSELEHP